MHTPPDSPTSSHCGRRAACPVQSLLLTAAVLPPLTHAHTRGHAAAGTLPAHPPPPPVLPSTALHETRGGAHACLSLPDRPPLWPLAPSSAGKSLHSALRAVCGCPPGWASSGVPAGEVKLLPTADGQAQQPLGRAPRELTSRRSGRPLPVLAQGLGPSPGCWHHQEPGLAALARPLPPGLVPGGCADCPAVGSAPCRHPRGPQPKPAAPGEEREETFLSGAPAQEQDTALKRRRPSSEAWGPTCTPGPECRLRWRLCLQARLSTPATAPPKCPARLRARSSVPPGLCAAPQLRVCPESWAPAGADEHRQAPRPSPRLHVWLRSLGACAGRGLSMAGRAILLPAGPSRCCLWWAPGGGGRGLLGFLPRGPAEALPLHCDLTNSPRFLATQSGNNGKP